MAHGRQQEILEQLAVKPLTTDELADRYFLSDETIRTYMSTLRKAGKVERRGGRWHRTDDDGIAGVPARPKPQPPSLPASIKREIDGI
ncbi:MAG TPA: HTH domain-containing protein [Vicinamibacterales bacterium]|nr:HTH domain-containing protein [Vicinamibacterales bacterium]